MYANILGEIARPVVMQGEWFGELKNIFKLFFSSYDKYLNKLWTITKNSFDIQD